MTDKTFALFTILFLFLILGGIVLHGILSEEVKQPEEVYQRIERLENLIHQLATTLDGNQVQWFNNIGANDVVLIPGSNVVEEIFQKCRSVELLSGSEIPHYKMWLKDRISKILDITTPYLGLFIID